MSAQECTRSDCPGCPLMVSRNGKDSFCARCDGGAKVGLPRPGLVDPLSEPLGGARTRASSPTSSLNEEEATGHQADLTLDGLAGLRARGDGLPSAPDTPPTPHSQLQRSPDINEFIDAQTTAGSQVVNSGGVISAEQAVRREQSDRASRAIGQRLLQGWTLLSDECQNETCYGVPLMRRPNASRNAKRDDNAASAPSSGNQPPKMITDPRRQCVVCGRDYLREADVQAWNDFLAQQGQMASTSSQPSTIATTAGTASIDQSGAEIIVEHSAAAKKRRFSSRTSAPIGRTTIGASAMPHDREPSKERQELREGVGKRRAVEASATAIEGAAPPTALGSSSTTSLYPIAEQPPNTGRRQNLRAAIDPEPPLLALQAAISTLSAHLSSLCAQGIVTDSASRSSRAVADAAEDLARAVRAHESVKAAL